MLKDDLLLLKGGKVVTRSQVIEKGYVLVSNGVIQAVGEAEGLDQAHNCKTIDMEEDALIFPGFIDPHLHGVSGADVMDGTIEALEIISKALPQEGTTSFLATTMTENYNSLTNAVRNVAGFMSSKYQGAEVLGLHLEGPFISPKQSGAQAEENIFGPSIERFMELQNLAKGNIRLVTLAPEEKNGLELVRHLKDIGVVSAIGHSDATYDVIQQVIKNGLSHATHLYNAMRPLHHREPGVVGGVFLHPEISAELILDGIHIAEEMACLAFKVKGSRKIQLITDSMRAKGMPEGEYLLGGQRVTVNKGEVRLANGSLAGSILKMNDALKRAYKLFTQNLCKLARLSSTNAAEELGIANRKGSIEVGKDGDLVVLNPNFEVLMTICKGEVQFIKSV